MSEPERPPHVRLTIVSPEQVLFDGRVEWVQVPLEDGLIGIWPGHGPLIAALAPGEIEYYSAEGLHRLAIQSGHLRVTETRCVVMISRLEGSEETFSAQDGRGDLFDQISRVLDESLSENGSGRMEESQRAASQ